MIARTPLPSALIRLAEVQAGVLARHQIVQAGVTPSVAARWAREWQCLGPGTYLVTSAGIDMPTPWQARLWAGILMGVGSARNPEHRPFAAPLIGGLAAAVVHGLADRIDGPAKQGRETRFVFRAEHDIDVHVDPRRRVTKACGYRFFRRAGASAFEAGDAPCTSTADTVLDLCDLSSSVDAIAWVDRACQQRVTTPAKLAAALEARDRAKHRADLLAILRGHVEGVTSELERIYRTDVEQAHGLPKAVRQQRSGTWILDNRYADYNVIVELDGRLGQTGEGRFRDRRRDNVHTIADQKSLRYGWHDCYFEPCGVAAEVAFLLRQLGWSGTPTVCPRCPTDVFALAGSHFA